MPRRDMRVAARLMLALAEGFRGQDIVSLLAMYQNWAKPKG